MRPAFCPATKMNIVKISRFGFTLTVPLNKNERFIMIPKNAAVLLIRLKLNLDLLKFLPIELKS